MLLLLNNCYLFLKWGHLYYMHLSLSVKFARCGVLRVFGPSFVYIFTPNLTIMCYKYGCWMLASTSCIFKKCHGSYCNYCTNMICHKYCHHSEVLFLIYNSLYLKIWSINKQMMNLYAFNIHGKLADEPWTIYRYICKFLWWTIIT